MATSRSTWKRPLGIAISIAFIAFASGPLLWRITGIGAVMAERFRRGDWPDFSDAYFRSHSMLQWMLHADMEPKLWLGVVLSLVLLIAWLLIERNARNAPSLTQAFRWMVVVWLVAVAGGITLTRFNLTGIY